MLVVGDDAYAIFATAGSARAFRIAATPAELERQVDALRATISLVEDSQQLTYPFDLERAYPLYQALFGPVAAELAAGTPPDLRARRGDAAAAAQPARHGPGRRSTPIAPAGGRPARRRLRFPRHRLARPRARHLDRGLGPRLPRRPPGAAEPGPRRISRLRRERAGARLLSCPAAAPAARPADAAGLHLVARRLEPADLGQGAGRRRPGGGRRARRRGRDRHRRRLHRHRDHRAAATSPIIASSISRPTAWSPPPRPECPARPALLTSFGGEGSDGLLTFGEIFDLRLDADLVILSACDTASRASAAATEEAGLARRRRVRAGRAGARLRRRRRPDGDRQPLAGARRFRRDRAADLGPVRGAARHRQRPARCATPSGR